MNSVEEFISIIIFSVFLQFLVTYFNVYLSSRIYQLFMTRLLSELTVEILKSIL